MPPENKKQKTVEIHLDPTQKTVWVDNLHMAKRNDDINCVRLSADLPEGLFEQVRFMTSTKCLEEFVDIICSTINYYPIKKQPEKAKPSKKSE